MTIQTIRNLLDIADRLEYESLGADLGRELDTIVKSLRRLIDRALAALDEEEAA
jgi:predicted transcriptional regulator